MVVLINHSIRSLRLVLLGKMESMIWQKMLKENDDSRRVKDKRDK
jgi:hypothetical protein